MTSVAVVTHHCTVFNRDIRRCVETVGMALPYNATHYVIDTPLDSDKFIRARYEAMGLGDIVIFVDDDDYVPINSIKACVEAMEKYNTGVVYTQETSVSKWGRHAIRTYSDIKYEQLRFGPSVVHHMTAYNSANINDRSIEMALKYKFGIEWIMRVDAAYTNGAVHLPINGYYWTHNDRQLHTMPEYSTALHTHIRECADEMDTWRTRSGIIPYADLA